jgi:hypothetical protein
MTGRARGARHLLVSAMCLSLVRCGGESSSHIERRPVVGSGGSVVASGGARDQGTASNEPNSTGGVSGRGSGGLETVVDGMSGKAATAGAAPGGAGNTGKSGTGGTAGRTTCGSDCSVPTGRPESVACPATSVTGLPVNADTAGAGGAHDGTCTVDADCPTIIDSGAHLNSTGPFVGRCLHGQCGFDQCLTDSDCPSGKMCACSTQFHSNGGHANYCIDANCRVDSDCGENGVCSVTIGYCGGPSGYYCHMPEDQCHTDVDCPDTTASACSYQPTLGYWACQAHAACAG